MDTGYRILSVRGAGSVMTKYGRTPPLQLVRNSQ
jgi:hypothetical protein